MAKSKYQQLAERRLSADTAQNRIRTYIQQAYDENGETAQQFKTSSARDSVEGSVALDLAAVTFRVRDIAKVSGDVEVANFQAREIEKIVKEERSRLSLTASGNRAFMASLAKAEERKGLRTTEGEA